MIRHTALSERDKDQKIINDIRNSFRKRNFTPLNRRSQYWHDMQNWDGNYPIPGNIKK